MQNPNLDNTIFGHEYIQSCQNLEHLEIGGRPNQYLSEIKYEEGIEKLTSYASILGINKLKIKVLKFEFCSHIGDASIRALL